MSAWLVDKAHIDALIGAAMTPSRYENLSLRVVNQHSEYIFTVDHTTADEIGQMLWNENLKSIHYRYPDTQETASNFPGPIEFVESDVVAYRYTLFGVPDISPIKMFKAIQCYEYQSCEHPQWFKSDAKAFCDALTNKMIGKLAGYDSGPWGVRELKEVMK